jgi:CRP/FNR family transcriptional regulator, cyclic AMP receptor protein
MTASSQPPVPLELGAHPFVAGLDHEFLRQIAEGAAERTFRVDETIVREGDPANSFYLLYEGKVALELVVPDRPRRTIQTIGPGEVLGWSWLLPPQRWRLDARALKPTRALSLDAPVLRRVLEARPADGYQFLLRLLPVVTTRLEMTRLQLMDLHGG